jgi:hypothetical protein
MTSPRVAVTSSSPFDAERVAASINDPDLIVVGAVTYGAIEHLISRTAAEVVVLAGDHQTATAERLRARHHSLKLVGTGSPDWCSDIDAWASDQTDVVTAVLSTFLY